MATYRMTPARAQALRRAQAASVLARRRRARRSVIRRRVGVAAAVGVGAGVLGAGAYAAAYPRPAALPAAATEAIVSRHVAMARYQHSEMSKLAAHANPTAPALVPFDAVAARAEATRILRRRRRRSQIPRGAINPLEVRIPRHTVATGVLRGRF